jgi:hypothetical protein
VKLATVDVDARRGSPLHVTGEVLAEGEPCPHVPVDIVLRDIRKGQAFPIGSVPTDERGAFAGALVIPAGVALGDYDVTAETSGDARCGGSR